MGSWQDGAARATLAAMPSSYLQAIARLDLLDHLRPFDPHVVGTLPLGVAMPGSDIDIVCQAADPTAFAARLWARFGAEAGFAMHQWIGAPRPVVARFSAHGWDIEVFGCALPVADQPGWRHFDVERRLLALGGPGFHAAVLDGRRQGLKTSRHSAAPWAWPAIPMPCCSICSPAPTGRWPPIWRRRDTPPPDPRAATTRHLSGLPPMAF